MLVDEIVADRLTKHGLPYLGEQLPTLHTKTDLIHAIEQISRRSEGELRSTQELCHLRERHRKPVTIEILVCEVMPVLSLDALEPPGDGRIGPEIQGTGVNDLLGERQSRVNLARHALRVCTRKFRLQRHQMPQWRRR